MSRLGCCVLIILLIASGCADTEVKERDESKMISLSVEGSFVTRTEGERVLVVHNQAQDFSATGGDDDHYDATWLSNVPEKLLPGQRIQYQIEGLTLTTYPGIAQASEVSLEPIERSFQSKLTPEEAIRLAMEANPNTPVFVVKEVLYDEQQQEWVVKYLDGVSSSKSQKPMTEIIKDRK